MDQALHPSNDQQLASLTVVGTGIELVAQVTLAAKAWLERADKVLYAVADPATAAWLKELNPSSEALPYPTDRARRWEIYELMVEHILSALRVLHGGGNLAVAFYGHPGVFADPAHRAIERARSEGFPARMLPGVSALDCLFADLDVDPGRRGCQAFEATDFLIRNRRVDPCSDLVLWQIGLIGNLGAYQSAKSRRGLAILCEKLEEYYGADHQVVVYEASVYSICKPVIHRVSIAELAETKTSELSTLYIPASGTASIDLKMAARLGLSSEMMKGVAWSDE